MRPSAPSKVALVGLVAGLACVYACSSGGVGGSGKSTGTGGGGSGGLAGSTAGGTADASGGGGGSGGLAGSTAGAAGQSTAGGTAGAADAGGAGGSGGLAGSTAGGSAGAAGQSAAGATGAGLGFGGSDITKVVPTTGCGMDPGQVLAMPVRYTIMTSGTKDPDCADVIYDGTGTLHAVCGPWMYTREYFVTLPLGYDKTKAYPLVFEGPHCGGQGNNLYALPDLASTVIHVGLTPPPNAVGHATNPGQGCFDWAEGDDSVEWPFYENLYDQLAGQLCFDRNRVFASGNGAGGMLASELGCKYAGDPTRPVRGVLANDGGLTIPKYLPTCTTNPTAGMWVHQRGATFRPFTQAMAAIARAMKVDGCTIGTGFLDAQFDSFPIGGGNPDTTCQKIKGCPALYPLVVCALPGYETSNATIANPGFSTFIRQFSAPPLLTP
jgi:hypothetical protein